MTDEIDQLFDDFGIPPPDSNLEQGEPPVPVDKAKLEALHTGKLERIEAAEIRLLIASYRTWYDADMKLRVDEADQRTNSKQVTVRSPAKRKAILGALFALAACLAGALLTATWQGWFQKDKELLIASLAIEDANSRSGDPEANISISPGRVATISPGKEYRLVIAIDRPGVAVIARLTDNNVDLFPKPTEPELSLRRGHRCIYGPFSAADSDSVILVFVSKTDTRGLIAETLKHTSLSVKNAKNIKQSILDGMWEFGCEWVASSQVTITPKSNATED